VKFAVRAVIIVAFVVAIVIATRMWMQREAGRFYSVRVVSGSVAETQAYYSATRAPATLAKWKEVFNVPSQSPGESLDGYRKRVNIVAYYNRNELGLGRELGCSQSHDSGLACFVTNYGQPFQSQMRALDDAVAGTRAQDTFTHVYTPPSTSNPPLGLGGGLVPAASYGVQFAAYDDAGRLKDSSQLDSIGPRPVPQICTNCHGGTYDATKHMVIGGQFTPLNPSILTFSSAAGYTLADQTPRLAAINALMAAVR
jgi:hypothetical protein